MSDHGHAHAAEAHGEHHAEYLGIPADSAGPDEPVTPGWLTLLGISLVLATLLGFVALRPDGKTRAELTPGASATAAAVKSAAPAAPTAPAPMGTFRLLGQPGQQGAGAQGTPPQGVRPVASGFLPRPDLSGRPARPLPPGHPALKKAP